MAGGAADARGARRGRGCRGRDAWVAMRRGGEREGEGARGEERSPARGRGAGRGCRQGAGGGAMVPDAMPGIGFREWVGTKKPPGFSAGGRVSGGGG